jgi:uncharacterized protein (TIGR03435 family)
MFCATIALMVLSGAIQAASPQAAQPPQAAPTTPSAATTAPGATLTAFDTVSIHQNKSGTMNFGFRSPANGVIITNAPLDSFVGMAFPGLRSHRYIFGLPEWTRTTRFNIQAKVDDDKVEALKNLTFDERNAARIAMMQQLFVDRFKMKFHREKKDFPAYSLVVAKGGPKLKKVDPELLKNPGADYHPGRFSGRATEISGQAVSMADLAKNLSWHTDREVLDLTGLTGKYDVALKWPQVIDSQPDAPATADDSQAEMFTALQDQLGLKLEASHAPISIDTIVVDHIEMPSEN